ncbi:MAG: signal peptidase I [Acidobacteriota bacterium]|nr:signal peptidase I [Acidobacteriota bacterium]
MTPHIAATHARPAIPESAPDIDLGTPKISPNPAQPAKLPSSHHEKAGPLVALQSLLYLVVTAIFIITFTVQPFRIPSESMESTLLVGDFLLVNKQAIDPGDPSVADSFLPPAAIHRGDIIVFHDPVDASLHLVKRVIGVPGDHLRLLGGRVYVNGRPLAEPYAVYRPSPPDNFRDNFPRLHSADPSIDSRWWIRMRSLIDNGELIIPTGSFFVLGDNRNDSEDSRYWGFVPGAAVVGKPLLIYFSLRQPSADSGDPTNSDYTGPGAATPFDTLAHTARAATPKARPRSRMDHLIDFARWDRTFQIIR